MFVVILPVRAPVGLVWMLHCVLCLVLSNINIFEWGDLWLAKDSQNWHTSSTYPFCHRNCRLQHCKILCANSCSLYLQRIYN